MIRIVGLLIIITFSSCASTNVGRPTYSDSVNKTIQLIKSKIIEEDFKTINVKIVNSHNGRYYLNSRIVKESDNLSILTNIKDMSGVESDTLIIFKMTEFLDKLDYEIRNEQTQLRLAGNYQDITVEYKDSKNMFYTRNAFGLMSLLRQGKTNSVEYK